MLAGLQITVGSRIIGSLSNDDGDVNEIGKKAIGPFQVPKSLTFQNEAKCTSFLVKMSLICMRKKNHFHIKC